MNDPEFVNLTAENLASEHLCCIIRSQKPHPGVETKRVWLRERLAEGHVFRKLDVKAPVFIEYAPLETAWTPVVGENYLYLYCLWVSPEYKGRGYGGQLLSYCLDDARARGKSGICMLGSKKQKTWLSDQSFAAKFGFETADEARADYRLLALSFDGTKPRFTDAARAGTIADNELTVFYSPQCPFIPRCVETVRSYCAENDIPARFCPVDTLEKAKALPCPFNNFAVFYGGEMQTVNLLDAQAVRRLTRRDEIRKS